jgi:hypothetical protein
LNRSARDLCAWLAGLIAFAALAAPAGAQELPTAGFDVTPANPRVGDQVQLVSSSCAVGGRLWSQDWDLNGDAFFGDATGATAWATFTQPGTHVVGLQVMSASGETSTRWRTILVDGADAPSRAAPVELMSPFPVVTLGGRLERGHTKVTLFTVQAPVCASVSVTCAGHGCPLTNVTARVGRGALRLRAVERRFRAGNRLTVAVSRGALVGKLTTFAIRRKGAPLRKDRCLLPGSSAGSRCPGD